MQNLNVILLAGGSSSRFAPLKEKNLYKFLGKTLIDKQINKFLGLGVKSITIITSQSNNDLIGHEAGKFSEDIRVLVQEGEGQAGAVKTGIEEIENGDVLIVNMNDVFEDDLLEEFSKKYDSLVEDKDNLLVGYNVESYFPGGYLELNDEGNVINVIEKPGEGNEPSSSVKIVFDYFADVNVLKKFIKEADSSKDDVYEVALSNMMKADQVFKLINIKTWYTIKYPWHVINTMDYFLTKIKGKNISSSAQISEGAVINGDVIIEDGVRVFDGAIINGPAFIGKDCVIGNHSLIRSSIIGEGCVIGGSEVARSYLGNNIWLHKNYVGDSILESNISFGSNALTANFRLDEKDIEVNIKGEKISSGRNKLGAIIGSDVRVGVGVMLMPGVKVGSNSSIGPGVVLGDDVENNKFVRVRQTLETTENNVDISKINREHQKGKL